MNEDHGRMGFAARALSGVRKATLANIRRSGIAMHEVQENFREVPTATLEALTEHILCMSLPHFSPY